MFCKYCGNQIDDNAKFCNNCGASQDKPVASYEPQTVSQEVNTQPAPQAQPPYTQPAVEQNVPQQSAAPQQENTAHSVPFNANAPVNQQAAAKASKKSNGCIVAILIAVGLAVLLVIGLIILAVVGFNVAKDEVSNSADSYSVAIEEDIADEVNPEYTEIFENNYIVDSPDVFIGLESRSFVSLSADGTIDKMAFGYDDSSDTIEELIETIYYPISDYDDATIESLDKAMKESFADADELECCTVTYQTTSDYYLITIHSTELDNASNLSSLSDAKVLVYDGFALKLSMDETANGLIAQGYIEK